MNYDNNKKNIAVCFFGLCRSTKYTIDSIKKYIYTPLDQMNFNYDIYLHSYTTNLLYSNPRNDEIDIKLDNESYKLLNANIIQIDDQDKLKQNLNLVKYRSSGDPWDNNFNSLDNHILALYSLYQLTQLWKNKTYDYIIYLRPDVLFINPLLPSYFENLNNNTIVLPNFHQNPVNDRFAIGTPAVMKIYGERYNLAYQYSLNKKLHAEEYLNYILKINSIKVIKINFKFYRIRANGINHDSVKNLL
jgi:hypothetical protein